jgi:hypothetical protein
MAERITANSPQEALDNFILYRQWQPFRYSGYKYLLKVSDGCFSVRERKPKALKAGQELYLLIN